MDFNWLKKLFLGRAAPRVADPVTAMRTRVGAPANDKQTPVAPAMLECAKPSAVSDHPQPLTVLKKLAPLRDFDEAYLRNLHQQTLSYAEGSVIFKAGLARDFVFYLLSGCIELYPNAKNSYTISDDSTFARLPIDSGKHFSITAVAKTEVTLLAVSGSVIQAWGHRAGGQQYYSLKTFELAVPEQMGYSYFCEAFCKACRAGQLKLPSLPHVATKLRKAMLNDISVKDVVSIIQVDAAIVAKLIQIANSALYAPTVPITNCHNAVTRLGFDATRSLVMSITTRQMFRCNNPTIMKLMQEAWKNSLQVSCLSFVIAEEFSAINPEDALLAGLICNIGVIPILHFAEQHPDDYVDAEALTASIALLNPAIGQLVLRGQGFSEELAKIPQYAEDWFYEGEGDALDLIEIVILAKLHSYIGTRKAKELPYINSVPAYAKLKNGELTPDFSLDALRKAQERLNTVMGLFS